jgi:hypothetical protein
MEIQIPILLPDLVLLSRGPQEWHTGECAVNLPSLIPHFFLSQVSTPLGLTPAPLSAPLG